MNKSIGILIAIFILYALTSCREKEKPNAELQSFSGIYPHLACYNNEGECGIGAVVPWQNDLWVVTYAPHQPFGSSDKLYRITTNLEQQVFERSTGGTPANRMIHKESNQLFIGPYAIDKEKNIRVIPYATAPGRYTGMARHLTDPANNVYIGTMEAGFYEVNANTLNTNTLYQDGNVLGKDNSGNSAQYSPLLPGCHGKGLYSGQGVMVFSNNGEDSGEAKSRFNIEAGSLSEWNGKEWKVIRRNQFTEVTGPGGIYGNPDPENNPIWATGWDYKSVLLGVRHKGEWSFYRLPKASSSYDGAHGWNTEWPRIRNIGTDEEPDYLMTMHGMFWKFPATFTSGNNAGIRPRSAYLKVIGDFTRWKVQLVFGCDDSAQKEFLNVRKAKGNIEGPGQSNSNLWFTDINLPDELGTATAFGSIWMNEQLTTGQTSDPYLFTGWDYRCAWIKNNGNQTCEFTFETDKNGNNQWSKLKQITVPPATSRFIPFTGDETGEWIRAKVSCNTQVTLSFVYSNKEKRTTAADNIFNGLLATSEELSAGGLLYGLGNDRRGLGLLAHINNKETGYYELNKHMELTLKGDTATAAFIRNRFAIPKDVVEVQESSILIVDDKGRRWRLPISKHPFNNLITRGEMRICREVATERDLFNCHGTFYELPAENADGYAKIRPIASHNFKINDYASYRGMLILTGIDPTKNHKDNKHIIQSKDNKAAVWAGTIDDLWKLGKPTGIGGPWYQTPVTPHTTSDPYLIGFYEERSLQLSHQSDTEIAFCVEIDPTGDGVWMKYETFNVKPGETVIHRFPEAFHARWIRFSTNAQTIATAWLDYK